MVTGKWVPSARSNRVSSVTTFCRKDMARMAGSSRNRGVSTGSEGSRAGSDLGPAEHPGPGRVHERDVAGPADGTDALAQAARDHGEVVLLALDLGVEVAVGEGDRPDGGQCVEQGTIGVVEGSGAAAAGDRQPQPAVGELQRRRQCAVHAVGGSALKDISAERSSDPAELSTAARVPSAPRERLTSRVASISPRKRIRSWRAYKWPSPRYRRTRRGNTASGRNSAWWASSNAVRMAMSTVPAATRSLPCMPPNTVLPPGRAEGGRDRDDGTRVHHQVAQGTDHRRPDLGVPRRLLSPVQEVEGQGSHSGRGHGQAHAEDRLDQGPALQDLRHDRHHREHDHRHGRRHEQDEQDEETLVEVERVRPVVDVEHDRPDPAGRHQRTEHDSEHGLRRARPTRGPEALGRDGEGHGAGDGPDGDDDLRRPGEARPPCHGLRHLRPQFQIDPFQAEPSADRPRPTCRRIVVAHRAVGDRSGNTTTTQRHEPPHPPRTCSQGVRDTAANSLQRGFQ